MNEIILRLSADEYEYVRDQLQPQAVEHALESVIATHDKPDPFYAGIADKLDPLTVNLRLTSTNTSFTNAQVVALARLHDRHGLELDLRNFTHQFDLPQGYVAGWVGRGDTAPGIYVGVSPEGEVSS
jgi:hypothetical protein